VYELSGGWFKADMHGLMVKHFILKIRRNVAFFYLLYQRVVDNKEINAGPVCFNYSTWLVCKFLPEREFSSIGVREVPFLTQLTKELRVPEIGRRTHIKYIRIVVVIDTTCCTVPVTPNNYIGGVGSLSGIFSPDRDDF
jgi:hypothetical protein